MTIHSVEGGEALRRTDDFKALPDVWLAARNDTDPKLNAICTGKSASYPDGRTLLRPNVPISQGGMFPFTADNSGGNTFCKKLSVTKAADWDATGGFSFGCRAAQFTGLPVNTTFLRDDSSRLIAALGGRLDSIFESVDGGFFDTPITITIASNIPAGQTIGDWKKLADGKYYMRIGQYNCFSNSLLGPYEGFAETSPGSTMNFQDVAYDPVTNVYVGVGGSGGGGTGTCIWATNGSNPALLSSWWRYFSAGTSNPARTVIYNQASQLWIVGGVEPNGSNSRCQIWTSPTGATWTQQYVSTTNASPPMHLAVFGSRTVMACQAGLYLSSLDGGITWTPIAMPTPSQIFYGTWELRPGKYAVYVGSTQVLVTEDFQNWVTGETDPSLFAGGQTYIGQFQDKLVHLQWLWQSTTTTRTFSRAFDVDGGWDYVTNCAIQQAVVLSLPHMGVFFGRSAGPNLRIDTTNSGQYFAFGYASGFAYALIKRNSGTGNFVQGPATLVGDNKWANYRIIATRTAQFVYDVVWMVDDVVLHTEKSVVLGNTTETANSDAFFQMPYYSLNMFDDIWFADGAGKAKGDLGGLKVVRNNANASPVQQWEKAPASEASNATAIGKQALSVSTSSVQSSAVGQKDEYSLPTFVVPAQHRVLGMVNTVALTRTSGLTTPTVKLGTKVNDVEVQTAGTVVNVPVNQSTVIQQLLTEPVGGTDWAVSNVAMTLERSA
ncbi:hypothetical protein [Achromobacter phage Motura]|uniref:Uncharacterized protein n=1 Tax=Achromobacter phage Motura TaxID=2591403 RepID=A0A514CTA6_9CAUD|nr:hypothetical protein H1O15_gp123 [Achromobacter phage Motura]QDH83705.1 hypothetical protein [Achromobacter phage Motura]